MTAAPYQIEDGIPIARLERNGAVKYPWRELQVGQSFFIADKKISGVSNLAFEAANRIGNGVRFTCRTVDGGVRVWRRS